MYPTVFVSQQTIVILKSNYTWPMVDCVNIAWLNSLARFMSRHTTDAIMSNESIAVIVPDREKK